MTIKNFIFWKLKFALKNLGIRSVCCILKDLKKKKGTVMDQD